MIARGTTPTIKFTFSEIDVSDITVAYLTLEQSSSSVTIEKELSDAVVGDDYLSWDLTQAETISLSETGEIKVQCKYKTSDSKVYASKIYTVLPYDVLNEDEI